jgi:hypothetical protein
MLSQQGSLADTPEHVAKLRSPDAFHFGIKYALCRPKVNTALLKAHLRTDPSTLAAFRFFMLSTTEAQDAKADREREIGISVEQDAPRVSPVAKLRSEQKLFVCIVPAHTDLRARVP